MKVKFLNVLRSDVVEAPLPPPQSTENLCSNHSTNRWHWGQSNRQPRTVLPAPRPLMREVPPIAFKEDNERGATEQINP
jgi:hypothetical protein